MNYHQLEETMTTGITNPTRDDQSRAAAAMLRALRHVAAIDPDMTLGRLMAFLAVADRNERLAAGTEPLPQKELWAHAIQGDERLGVYGTFSAQLTYLSERVLELKAGRVKQLGLIEMHAPAADYRQKVPTLTIKGWQLLAKITRSLQQGLNST